MKLIPQVKPVRIRISCDGQEHFSLASLRQSFRCNEMAELLGAPLVKWLKQQNESEVADRVKSLIDRKERCSPVELASAFFTEDGIDKVDAPLSLFDFWLQHGYQYNAIKFVEDCYQTYKTDPDAENLFYEYLRLDDKDQQRNVLFLLNEDIDTNLAGIPLAIAFWRENGYKLEADTFIRGHLKLFANDPKLKEFLLTRKKEKSERTLELQKISTAAATKALTAQGYIIEDLKSIMHERFNGLSDNELVLCMYMALHAKEGTVEPKPAAFNDKWDVLAFLQLVGSTIGCINSCNYIEKYNFYDGRTTFYHIYDLIIYNILRRLVGFSISYPRRTAAASRNLCAAYYKYVDVGKPSSAVDAIRLVCDSYMFSEARFKRRHGTGIPYIYEK